MYLFFDTETTGIPRNYNSPITDLENWPRMISIAWVMYDDNRNLFESVEWLIKPEGFTIPEAVSAIHHITTEIAERNGIPLREALERFSFALSQASVVVGHNLSYDVKIVGAEMLRCGIENRLQSKRMICTMKASTDYCKIPGPYGNKWPKLNELVGILFKEELVGAHDALTDIKATARCYFQLERLGVL